MTWWQYIWANHWHPGDKYTRQANRELYEWSRDLRRQVKRDLRELKKGAS